MRRTPEGGRSLEDLFNNKYDQANKDEANTWRREITWRSLQQVWSSQQGWDEHLKEEDHWKGRGPLVLKRLETRISVKMSKSIFPTDTVLFHIYLVIYRVILNYCRGFRLYV
jgi:hypothetical protein